MQRDSRPALLLKNRTVTKTIKRWFSLFLSIWVMCLPTNSLSEKEPPVAYLTVKAKLLNGRSAPRKKASKEAFFDFGDIVYATGEWSDDHKWIEVEGGETGTVWISIRYVTEKTGSFKAKNANYDKVKVRKWPEIGRVTHYIRRGQTVNITQVVLGWGRTRWGWVDLYYMEGV